MKVKAVVFIILILANLSIPLVSQATVTFYDFEDGTTDSWVNDTSGGFMNNLGVPSNSNDQAQSGSRSLSYPLNLDVKDPGFNSINDTGFVTFGTPKNLTDAQGMDLYLYIPSNANISPATPALASIYVKTGPDWTWFESNDYTKITPGNWTKININFSLAKNSSGNTNQQVTGLDEVHQIGFHISGANTSAGQTNLYMDTVEFQGPFAVTIVTTEVEGVINAIKLTGSIDFGLVPLGGEVVSDGPLTVENIGTAPVTLSLSLVDPPLWEAVATNPGNNTYVLNAMFNDAKPVQTSFNEIQHAVLVDPRRSSGVIFAGNQLGVSVLPGEKRTLWLEFRAPLLTEVDTQQAIKMIISAEISADTGLSVSLDTHGYNFGILEENISAVSTTPIVVSNNGSVSETYWLQLSEPQTWTHSTRSTGENIYILNAAFDSSGSVMWDNTRHALDTKLLASGAQKFAGDQSGLNVLPGEKRYLWFQLQMPTRINTSEPENIRVMLVASQF
jgi:hypothetical protein